MTICRYCGEEVKEYDIRGGWLHDRTFETGCDGVDRRAKPMAHGVLRVWDER